MIKLTFLLSFFISTSLIAKSSCYDTLLESYNKEVEKQRTRNEGGVFKKIITEPVSKIVGTVLGVFPIGTLAKKGLEKTSKVIIGKDEKAKSAAVLILAHQLQSKKLRIETPEDALMLSHFLAAKQDFLTRSGKTIDDFSHEEFANVVIHTDSGNINDENPFCNLAKKRPRKFTKKTMEYLLTTHRKLEFKKKHKKMMDKKNNELKQSIIAALRQPLMGGPAPLKHSLESIAFQKHCWDILGNASNEKQSPLNYEAGVQQQSPQAVGK